MTVPETGVWQHLAVTYEGNTVTHYLNGQINGQTDISTLREDTDGTFRIGNRADLVTQFLGLMDDVVMMNRAATDAEVLDLMAGGLGGGDPTPPDGGGGFAISEVRVDEGGNLQATFNSLPDNVYVAEFSTNLIDWSVTVDDIASDGDLTTVRQPRPEAPSGFIRIRLKE